MNVEHVNPLPPNIGEGLARAADSYYGDQQDSGSAAADEPINGCGTFSPTGDSITRVISGLESFSETVPAVLQVANGWAPAGTAFKNRDLLLSAVEMLKTFRNDVARRWEIELHANVEVGKANRLAAIESARADGIAFGIEQEKNRVKEARRARSAKH